MFAYNADRQAQFTGIAAGGCGLFVEAVGNWRPDRSRLRRAAAEVTEAHDQARKLDPADARPRRRA